ncbi:hypothetical protein Hanom_Chr12g01095061 [Helianthus anomalus]
MPQYFTTCLKKSLAVSAAVTSVGAGMNVPYLENLSTTTMMLPDPSDFGKQVMKSIEMLSQGPFGIGKGSNKPLGWCCSILSCWQTKQVCTYASTSSAIRGQ